MFCLVTLFLNIFFFVHSFHLRSYVFSITCIYLSYMEDGQCAHARMHVYRLKDKLAEVSSLLPLCGNWGSSQGFRLDSKRVYVLSRALGPHPLF